MSTGKSLPPTKDYENFEFLYYSSWRTFWIDNATINHRINFKGGHNFRDPENRALAGQTKLKKYGNSNFTNREKAKQTCLKKYGVDNVAKLPSVTEKKKKTLMVRYGKVFNFNNKKEKYNIPENFKLEYEKGYTHEELADMFNVSYFSITEWVKRLKLTRKKMTFKFIDFSDCICSSNFTPADEENLIKAVKRVYEIYQKVNKPLIHNLKNFPIPVYSIEKHYGTWNNFLKIAGIPLEREYENYCDIVKDFFNLCKEKGKFLSFYKYGKLVGQNKMLKLKRMFNNGGKYSHLKVELKKVWSTDYTAFLNNFV